MVCEMLTLSYPNQSHKMGQSYSYFNIWAVSTIVTATSDDIEQVLQAHEAAYRMKLLQSAAIEEEVASAVSDQEESFEKKKPALVNYIISERSFIELLENHSFTKSDIDILVNMFHLIDTRGFREIDMRDAFISFSVLVAKSVHQGFEMSMQILEREDTQILDKLQLIHIFKLMNVSCHYFGDRHLAMDQIQDLADSVYTSIGRIDGTIYYPHFVEYIVAHPIIEMFMSLQFQGGVKDKLLSDEEIDAMVDKT